jgi:H/ACA ribonucleoprotein complex subunit 4|tara:strand:- start:2614 stop:3522 length:909 start_codon:yes stop_codon:yes gene_type:complete
MKDISKTKSKKSLKELLEFGILNIDKPSGPTSFDISDFVRKTLKPIGVRKTSHFGTLDPKVTGVLPVALNRACKLTGFFIGEDKEYVGIMRIHEDITLKEIKKAIKEKFTGIIKQIPPVKSRVKRQEREREVKKFELLEKEDKDILFLAEVQGGTYIRKLIDDLGKELNIGAHMLELRRTRAGIFEEENKEYPSVNLYDFEKAVEEAKKGKEELLKKIIIPGEIISRLCPVIEIKEKEIQRLFTGKPIYEKDILSQGGLGGNSAKKDETICAFAKNKFIGMYKIVNEKHVFAKAMFVMQPIK